MGQALEQKKEEKKRNLLEAARILFSQKGISKTSISEIAQAAKVAKGTFYLYFKDKDELLEHLILQISRNIVTLAYEHTEQHRTENFTENVIIFVDYIITYFSSHQDSLSLIKRNFTWSMVQHSLEQEENDKLRQQLLEQLQASPTSHNYSQRELFNIIYMIVELCGSVCYTSIIEQVPDTIDHIKPLLYTMIRRILNHEPDQTNPDF